MILDALLLAKLPDPKELSLQKLAMPDKTFLAFCCSTHITNPYIDLLHLASKNYFLVCYTVLLIQGNTISGTTVQSSTIKNFVNTA